MKRYTILLLLFGTLFFSCANAPEDAFVRIENGRFECGGEPYYYIGTNYWYGGVLASQKYGDRERLARELDAMKAAGIVNLRVLAGAEGPSGQKLRVSQTLVTEPGQYDDDLLDGLDYFLSELDKRDMKAVLFLTNTWDWSGGYGQWLAWRGHGEIPYPKEAGWNAFADFIRQFITCEECQGDYFRHVEYMIGRTNRYTDKKYTDDPAIMSWQIANEPRALGEENKEAFAQWVARSAALIKSLDKNHLVSTGSEGEMGSEGDMELFGRIHSDVNIDYLTIHLWPKNWRWLDPHDMDSTMAPSMANAADYIERHIAVARQMNKPLVIEEFGLPRDGEVFTADAPTTYRDMFYGMVFSRVAAGAKGGDVLSGCNFWAFGGEGRPSAKGLFWAEGEDFLGDPPCEEQGLNSVFDTDSTMDVIRAYADSIATYTKTIQR